MLISLEHRFIFIANLKTASTSIEKWLQPYAEIALVKSEDGKHLPFRDIEERFRWIFDNTSPSNFFIFGVMRDPIELALSLYNSHLKSEFHETSLYTGNMSFDEFLGEWLDNHSDQTEAQFTRFLDISEKIAANYIISYNKLKDGLRFVSSILNISDFDILEPINISPKKLEKKDLSKEQISMLASKFSNDIVFMKNYCDKQIYPDEASQFQRSSLYFSGFADAASEVPVLNEKTGILETDLIQALYRLLLLREPDQDGLEAHLREIRNGRPFEEFLRGFLRSREFATKQASFGNAYFNGVTSGVPSVSLDQSPIPNELHASWIPDLEYRCPTDLTVSPISLRRLIVIGQCLVDAWPNVIKSMEPGCQCDFFLFNFVQQLPERPPAEPSEYDFQLVSIPLRTILPDSTLFRLSYDEPENYRALFDQACERLRQSLATALRWNSEYGLLTFVTNFMLPQQNPMGRLLPRYDLRNLVYFIERLNEALSEEISRLDNVFLFDFDQILSTFGRKYFQDDVISISSHGGMLSDYDFEFDQDRLEPAMRATTIYEQRVQLVYQLGWKELLTMYRTIRQLDMVKLVVVDIDDTLWRGIAAERTEHSGEILEGWPIGFAEALAHLKRRGVLLALLSKNEETLILPIWERLFGGRLSFDDFVIRKINWRPKAENFDEILQEANLLAHSAVYFDDNPVERAAIEAAFPGVRTFGSNPLIWRRILLWSAETQVPTITKESASRTKMVHAQVERETQRKRLSREEFLMTLDVKIFLRKIDNVDKPGFTRALELINKSNQFNTTGRRWTRQEFNSAFAENTGMWIFDVEDRFTKYGIVGVVIVRDSVIVQFVMSCRVVGMEVEIAAITELLRIMGGGTITALLDETDLNLLVRDLWERCGFELEGGRWIHPRSPHLRPPQHVKIVVEADASQAMELTGF